MTLPPALLHLSCQPIRNWKKDNRAFWVRLGEEQNFSPKSIDGVQAVYRILMIFAFTPIFWALWDQNLAEWVLQAKKLDLNIFDDNALLHLISHEIFLALGAMIL